MFPAKSPPAPHPPDVDRSKGSGRSEPPPHQSPRHDQPDPRGTVVRNYKTKLCRHFELGRCKLAGLCNFSHGDDDGLNGKGPGGHRSNSRVARNPLETKFDDLEDRLERFAQKQKGLLRAMAVCRSSLLTDNSASIVSSQERPTESVAQGI